jgi:spermidine synthase
MSRIEHGASIEMAKLEPNFMTFPDPPAVATGDEPIVSSLFCVETSDPFDSYTYRLESIRFSGRTGYQSVVIAKTYNYGLALFLDGQIQSAEDDEALYHELLVQPAMLRHPSPKDVLILGGGEGATLREVLVHESVRSATMVDLDGELVDLCRQYLDTFHMGAFDDPRGRLIIGDGRAFLEQDQNLYDVIIVDLVDMIEHTQISRLYTVEFYQLVRQRLRPGGIVAVQGLEFSFLDDEAHAAVARTLRAVFTEVHSYRAHIPSFLAGWGFMWASDWARPDEWSAEAIDATIADRLGDWLDHVNGPFVKSCFAMCKDTILALAAPGPVLQDGVAFVPPVVIEVPEPTRAIFPYRPGT